MSDPDHLMPGLIQQHHAAILDDWLSRLAPFGVDLVEARREVSSLLSALAIVLGGGPDAALEPLLREASQVRAARGQAPEESVAFVHAGRDALLALLQAQAPGTEADRSAARARVQGVLDRCVMVLVSHFMSTRESVIRSQAQSLLDMSTPVISLWDSILLLPLVGVVDSMRAVQVAERLLEAIGRTEAEVTLIDVTGVPVMDTSVARHLLRTVAAAQMLGTQVILTGISPTTAQTMVKLGIDLSSVPTRGSLKAGVALALAQTGRAVADRRSSSGKA